MLYFTTCRVVLIKEGLALPPHPSFPAVEDDTSIESVFSNIGSEDVPSSPACSSCTSLSLDGADLMSFPELHLPAAHDDLMKFDDSYSSNHIDRSSLFSDSDVASFLMDAVF